MGDSLEKTAPESSLHSLRIRLIRFEGIGINSYELVDPDGGELPPFTAGAHIDLHLGDGTIRQYSLSNAPSERYRYVIAVLCDENGRGGSRRVHSELRAGQLVKVGGPRNHFPMADSASRVVLLAGGIGVTPLKAMLHRLEEENADYILHYCAKDASYTAFADELRQLEARGRVRFHFDRGNPADGLDIAALLTDPGADTQLYYCGPGGFMSACAKASQHWPAANVHSEHFKAPVAAAATLTFAPGAFSVVLARSGKAVEVAAHESVVDALQRVGVHVETSCQSGLCGTCKVRHLGGEPDHQDFILGENERSEYMTACVSRAKSATLTLDL